MQVDQTLAEASDRLIYASLLVYALAMVAMAAQWAFGNASRFTPVVAPVELERKVLVGVGGPDQSLAADPAIASGAARSERFGRIGFSLASLAFLLHLAGVVARGLSAERVPWGNMYEFSIASALAAMGVFLVLARRYDAGWMGIFVVPPVLLTLGLAVTVLYTDAQQLQPALQSYWLVIHVVAAVISGGAFTIGAALSVLYLVRERAESRGSTTPSRLPTAHTLDRMAYRVHAFVFPLWTFAVIAGAIWAENAWGRYWGWDPKETWAFITWVVYAGYLHARATAGWKGRSAAIVALVGFGTFLFNYFVINMLVVGLHSYAGT
ncbi:MAG: c-type cytochrome biogenesis protein CcsB [Sporichthyaceae bacterium]